MGWLISVAYTLPYMAAGILAACVALRNEGPAEKVAVGSGMGLFLMMWLPALASFAMGFTALAQAVALIPCLVFIVFAIKVMRSRSGGSPLKPSWDGLKACLLRERTALFVVAPLTALFLILLSSHSLMPDGSGNLTVGQSTYGDLSLHAGLITSISEQGAFPPMYSLVSGEVPVGYPFLCDSVSASPHTLGAGLREAYMVPMAFAAFAVFLCAFAFFRMWLRGGGRAAFATVTFFVGGGFGFAYFLDLYKADPSAPGKLQAMMEGFYTTPTNLVDKGVYWVNAIADLMIPQRATLFGWAVLIPCLYLLIKGLRVKGGAYLTIAGVMAGGLPLIHTHSFLALGVIGLTCMAFATCDAVRGGRPWPGGEAVPAIIDEPVIPIIPADTVIPAIANDSVEATIPVDPGIAADPTIPDNSAAPKPTTPAIAADPVIPADPTTPHDVWGTVRLLLAFGLIAAALALPQLLAFTFRQSSGEGFVRFHFNWVNSKDGYIWFYVKNVGIPFILMVPAMLHAGAEKRRVFAGGLAVFAMSELVVFQPNAYDNNKLLYVWFFLLCGLVAAFLADLYASARAGGVRGALAAAAAVCVVMNASGALTLAREYVSSYVLFSSDQAAAAAFIKSRTDPGALFLTADNHNNAVAALTGRNIVCGSGVFLYFHGIDYGAHRAAAMRMMTEPTLESLAGGGVDYVFVSPYERSMAGFDEGFFAANYHAVYKEGSVTIYRVR